jgi:hypothetical protein
LHRTLASKRPLPWVELEPEREAESDAASPVIERNERWHVVVRHTPELDQ